MGHNTPGVLVVRNKVSAGRLVQKMPPRAPWSARLGGPPTPNARSGGWLGGDPLAGPLEGVRNCSYLLLAVRGDPATTALPWGQAARHLLCGSGKADKKNDWFLRDLPMLRTCMQALFGEGGGRRRKLTGIRCCNLHLGCDVWAPDTSRSRDPPRAVKQEQYLPAAAPAVPGWQRAFRSSGEKHHRNLKCCSYQQETGARAPRAGTWLTFPTVQLAQYNTVSVPPAEKKIPA